MLFLITCFFLVSAKKVVVQGSNTAHLMDLQALALSLELPTYLVQDAGRTQVTKLGIECMCVTNTIHLAL